MQAHENGHGFEGNAQAAEQRVTHEALYRTLTAMWRDGEVTRDASSSNDANVGLAPSCDGRARLARWRALGYRMGSTHGRHSSTVGDAERCRQADCLHVEALRVHGTRTHLFLQIEQLRIQSPGHVDASLDSRRQEADQVFVDFITLLGGPLPVGAFTDAGAPNVNTHAGWDHSEFLG
jgi:hypothetical protein